MKQMEAWQSYDLTTKGLKDYAMYLPTLTLASTFFFTENYHNDSTGWLIGEDSAYGLPIFFDPFHLTKIEQVIIWELLERVEVVKVIY